MMYTYYDREVDISLRSCVSFSLKRIAKLYPLHIITMLFAVPLAIQILMESFSKKALVYFIEQLGLNITLTQSWIARSGIYFSLNGVAWYLSASLFIYMFFPIIHSLIKKCNKTWKS